jgi:hypothetical protein
LLAGSRSSYLDWDFNDQDFDQSALFWTSDLATNLIDNAWARTYSSDEDEIERDPYRIGYGGTIRCVRD